MINFLSSFDIVLIEYCAQEDTKSLGTFGTSINHFISYFYVTMLGLFAYLEDKNFKKLVPSY